MGQHRKGSGPVDSFAQVGLGRARRTSRGQHYSSFRSLSDIDVVA